MTNEYGIVVSVDRSPDGGGDEKYFGYSTLEEANLKFKEFKDKKVKRIPIIIPGLGLWYIVKDIVLYCKED